MQSRVRRHIKYTSIHVQIVTFSNKISRHQAPTLAIKWLSTRHHLHHLEMASPSSLSVPIFILFISILSSTAQVPPSDTFQYVNEGDFGGYINEYNGNYRVLDLFTSPFTLVFYNTTPIGANPSEKTPRSLSPQTATSS